MRMCEQLSKQGPMRTQRCFGHKSSRSGVYGTKCAANGVWKRSFLWLADKDSEEYKELQAEKARLRARRLRRD